MAFLSLMKHSLILLPLLVVLFLLTGCDGSIIPPLLGGSTPEPTTMPISPDELISYRAVYTVLLAPGEKVPGAQLEYVGKADNVYQVKIDGLVTNKRIGDSFAWRGIAAPGVFTAYNLRIGTEVLGELAAAGTVDVMVLNPTPTALDASLLPARAADYSGIIATYTTLKGATIPGTTLQFVEVVSGQAQIAGRVGYPYVAVADSLDWLGQLNDNVIVRYNLRVSRIDTESIRTDGTVDIWLVP